MDPLISLTLGAFGWVAYLNPLVLASVLLGFLGWSVYLTPFIVTAFILVLYLAFGKRQSPRLTSWVLVIGFVVGAALTTALPFLNAAYLRAVGTHSPAVIERITTFKEPGLGRTSRWSENMRLDLRVTMPDGSEWKTFINRRAGVVGPTFIPGSRLASGDEIVVAYIDAFRQNLVVVPSESPAVWQAAARDLDASWEIMPPGDNPMFQEIHRRRIQEYLDRFDIVADAAIIERLNDRLEQMTAEPPPYPLFQ